MPIEMSSDIQRVDWEELAGVVERAPLGPRDPIALQSVFINSRHRCFLFDGGVIVGAARALSDGYDCAVICDVVVLPEYQGQKLGSRMVSFLLDRLSSHRKVILYTVPGKEGFYEALGFRRMKTAMAIFQDQGRAQAIGLVEEG